jgi:acyl carrier protein
MVASGDDRPLTPLTSARAAVAAAIGRVAPEVDVEAIDPASDLRDAAGLDSMDFLEVIVAVYEATGVEVPERDYPRLATLSGFVAYLAERAADTDASPDSSSGS